MKKIIILAFTLLAFAATQAQNVDTSGKANAPSEGLVNQRLISDLVHYGVDHTDALPLIQALRLIKATPQSEENPVKDGQSVDSKEKKKDDNNGAKKQKYSLDYNDVLALAKDFADDDETLNQLIAQVETQTSAERGRTAGVTRHWDSVRANHTDTYTMRFRGGETAMVYVDGDGDTDLDLYVYDENGNLIGSDTDRTDTCLVRWSPRWTGDFKIKIKNLGNVYNRYLLVTN